MKKTILLGAFSVLALLGCAKAEYVTPDSGNNPQNKPQASTCPYFFPATGACATIEWLKPPSTTEEVMANLHVKSGDRSYDDITVVLWMPSMGHGSAPVEIRNMGGGDFNLRKIYFIMPGDWEIRISLIRSGEVIDSFFIPLLVP